MKAGSVPVAAAQALTLRFELGHGVGLQEVGGQEAASLLVEDIDGYPLSYLTVLGPDAKGDFWEALEAALASDAPHYLAATGASYLYSPTQFVDEDKDTLARLRRTLRNLGGRERFKRVVGFGLPGQYYLEDGDGNLWDVYSGKAARQDVVEGMSREFHKTMARLAKERGYRKTMAQLWRCILGEASKEECQGTGASAEAAEAASAEAELLQAQGYDAVSLQSLEADPAAPGYALADMTGADGELDFGKAQKVIAEGGAGNFSNFEAAAPQWRKKYCLGWFCYGEYWVLEARINKNQPVRKNVEWHTIGGNWQEYYQYGYRWKDYFDSGDNNSYSNNDRFPDKFHDSNWNNFSYYHADVNTWVQGGVPAGCGPAAFIRLAAWFQFERHWYTRRSNVNWYGGSTPNLYYAPLSSPSYMYRMNSWLGGRMLSFHKLNYGGSKLYYPDLVLKMGTKVLNDQGFTWPDGFYNGANAWLNERGSSLNLHGAWYYLLPPNPVRWILYSLVMNSIGLRNEPGVMLFQVQQLSLEHHYTPTLEGRLYNWRTTAEVLVRVPWGETGSSADGHFINITGILPSDRAGGYYALY